jgi:hypothetical protein
MIDWNTLRAPMDESAIEWRVQRSGEKNGKPWAAIVPYADARFLMDRLDEVCGPENWTVNYEIVHTGHVVPQTKWVKGEWVTEDQWMPPSVIASIGIRVGEGEHGWVWKADAAEFTDFAPTKGGATGAFRRACVPWNVASVRDLYAIDGPVWANIHSGGKHRDKIAGSWLEWDPPALYGPDGLLNGGSGGEKGSSGEVSQEPREGGETGIPLLDRSLTRGKHKGKTWAELIESEPDYVRWALDKTEWFDPEQAEMLRGLLDSLAEVEVAATDDDLPF